MPIEITSGITITAGIAISEAEPALPLAPEQEQEPAPE
jgi:hypothetical protein